jgi:hypothetical protein
MIPHDSLDRIEELLCCSPISLVSDSDHVIDTFATLEKLITEYNELKLRTHELEARIMRLGEVTAETELTVDDILTRVEKKLLLSDGLQRENDLLTEVLSVVSK